MNLKTIFSVILLTASGAVWGSPVTLESQWSGVFGDSALTFTFEPSTPDATPGDPLLGTYSDALLALDWDFADYADFSLAPAGQNTIRIDTITHGITVMATLLGTDGNLYDMEMYIDQSGNTDSLSELENPAVPAENWGFVRMQGGQRVGWVSQRGTFTTVAAVPEPAPLAMMCIALVGVLSLAREPKSATR